MNIAIAGGGVAGLEALLALHELAGDRVSLTLIAPDPDFSYRPMAVAEPFALGGAHRVPLTSFAEETGAELVQAAVIGVDDAAGELRLDDGGKRSFDAAIVAPRRRGGLRRAPARHRGRIHEVARDGRAARLGLAAAGLRAGADDGGRGARDGPRRRR